MNKEPRMDANERKSKPIEFDGFGRLEMLDEWKKQKN